MHDLQVLERGTIPTAAHDIHVDLIVTPDQVVRCARPTSWSLPRLAWDDLTDAKIEAIPLLQRLRR